MTPNKLFVGFLCVDPKVNMRYDNIVSHLVRVPKKMRKTTTLASLMLEKQHEVLPLVSRKNEGVWPLNATGPGPAIFLRSARR